MQDKIQQIIHQISHTIIGKEPQIKLALTCILANGHLLIEDLPGMGKTSLSHGLARVLGLDYSRIQFTSDLLPADIIGVNIFDTEQQLFNFHAGPVFNQLLLADEINRASPKTQSALLEAMEESQVSVDGITHTLPEPFFVIATQNPLHQAGTYPLPESQLDRFLMRIQMGYPDWDAEKKMLEQLTLAAPEMEQVISPPDLRQLQQQVSQIHASEEIIHYILRLVVYSRTPGLFPHSLSPRASKALLQCDRSWALIHQRDYVIPEDVQAILPAATEHRLGHHQTQTNEPDKLSRQLILQTSPVSE